MTPAVQPSNLLEVIAHVAADPRFDPEKMKALLDMQERVVADERRTKFFAALSNLTAKLPPIPKRGKSHHGPYAKLEDIDKLVRPFLAGEGFAMSFDSSATDKGVRVTCRLTHRDGHSETKEITLPLDNSGSKNGAQSVISTVSYARRALTNMFFNLVTEGDDQDGNSLEPVSNDEAQDIETGLADTGSDVKKFLEVMNATSVRTILKRDYKKAMSAIADKRRKMRA